MKEFVEKLIGRLEEKAKIEGEKCDKFAEMNMCESVVKYNHGEYCYIDAISIVNQLAEEYNNDWIPVSEKLPETNESVLCWAKSTARGGDVCFVGSCHNGFWFLQSSANTHSFPGQYKIVAWQPLPEPYQKGENE